MTPTEIELLILENAADSQRQFIARCKRRVQDAERELTQAWKDLQEMETRIGLMRDTYLRRTV